LFAPVNSNATPTKYFFDDELSICETGQCVGSPLTGFVEIDNPVVGHIYTDWSLIVDYRFSVGNVNAGSIEWNKTESAEGMLSVHLNAANPNELFVEYFKSINGDGYELTVDGYSPFFATNVFTGTTSPPVGIAKAAPVPEPASMFLLGTGLLCLTGIRMKRSKRP
jgi:hypothetical protein